MDTATNEEYIPGIDPPEAAPSRKYIAWAVVQEAAAGLGMLIDEATAKKLIEEQRAAHILSETEPA